MKQYKGSNMIEYWKNLGTKFIDSGDTREETLQERLRLFNGRTHPTVEGYSWHRGIGISVDKGTVLFYLPWTQEGDPAYPIIYSLGKVSHNSMREYSRKMSEKVLELAPKHRKPHLTLV